MMNVSGDDSLGLWQTPVCVDFPGELVYRRQVRAMTDGRLDLMF